MTLFAQRVYDLLRQVPKGGVTTYKALAEAMGTRAYRAIGQVLRRNPNAPVIPCHRVVKANGELGGFMGQKDGEILDSKIELLKQEGVMVVDNRILNFQDIFFDDFKG